MRYSYAGVLVECVRPSSGPPVNRTEINGGPRSVGFRGLTSLAPRRLASSSRSCRIGWRPCRRAGRRGRSELFGLVPARDRTSWGGRPRTIHDHKAVAPRANRGRRGHTRPREHLPITLGSSGPIGIVLRPRPVMCAASAEFESISSTMFGHSAAVITRPPGGDTPRFPLPLPLPPASDSAQRCGFAAVGARGFEPPTASPSPAETRLHSAPESWGSTRRRRDWVEALGDLEDVPTLVPTRLADS